MVIRKKTGYNIDIQLNEAIDPIVIISEQPLEETVSAVEIEEYVEDTLLPREDIELIALVTMAEAEGECEEARELYERLITTKKKEGQK